MFYVTSRFLYVHPGTYDDRGRETRLRQDGTLAGGKVFRLGCVHYSDTDPSFFIFRTASALHRLSQKQSVLFLPYHLFRTRLATGHKAI